MAGGVILRGGGEALAVRVGSSDVARVMVGDVQVWPYVDESAPEHSIWAAYPYTLTRYTDGTPNIELGNAFYRIGAGTDGWRCVGGRVYIPSGVAASLPATATVRLWTTGYGAGVVPDLSGNPLRSATATIADGWCEARWSPYAPAVGGTENLWVTYDFGNGNYLHAPLPGIYPVQASDGSALYLRETNSRSVYRIGAGASTGSEAVYGVDWIVDEGGTPPGYVSDDFNRADSTDLGTGWSELLGQWAIVSNALRLSSGSGETYLAHTTARGGADHASQVTISGAATEACVMVRFNNTSNTTSSRMIMARYGSGAWQIYYKASGSYTSIANVTATQPSYPYTMRLESRGSQHSLYVNEHLVARGTYDSEAVWTGRYVGIRAYQTSTAVVFDDFAAWDLK